MNHHILHIQPNGADSLPWKSSLEAQKLQVLVAKSINDAPTFCRAYALLMVLVDLEPDSEDLTEALSSIRSVCREHPGRTDPPVIGLCGADLTCEQRERFAHMGLDWVAVRSDPEPFVLWHVHILKKLADLSSFEKSQMDVGQAGNADTRAAARPEPTALGHPGPAATDGRQVRQRRPQLQVFQ